MTLDRVEPEVYWLTYKEAADRVHRRPRTIRYWRTRGMPMGWEERDGNRVRVVRLDVLLAWWRERMSNDPIWQQHLRKQRRHAEETS
jgi:hypothetical protein